MAKVITPPAEFDTDLVASNAKVGKASTATRIVERADIHEMPDFNMRITGTARHKAKVEHICNSILINGFYEDKPLTGFVAKAEDGSDTIFLTDGYTRIEAFDLAVERGFEGSLLPITIKPKGTSMEDLLFALVDGNGGDKPTVYELALVVSRLLKRGVEKTEVARRFQISERYIDELLSLVAAPKSIRDLVAQDKISATLAISELAEHGAAAIERLKAGLVAVEASGGSRVTKKHLEKTAGKKKADAKGSKATKLDKGDTTSGDVLDSLSVARIGGLLTAMTLVESALDASALKDDLLQAIMLAAGADSAELINVSLEKENYVESGLVRLGFVKLEPDANEEAPSADAAEGL